MEVNGWIERHADSQLGDIDYRKIWEFVTEEVNELKIKIEIINNKLNNG